MDRMLRNKWAIAFFVLPAFVVYALILPIPILQSVYYSFFSWDLLGAMKFIGLENYIQLFTKDPFFFLNLKNTFIFTVASIILQIPLALLLAFWLNNEKLKGARIFRNIFFLPTVLSGTAIGLLWQFIYQPDIGLINGIIHFLGFPGFHKAWLSSTTFAIYGVVISISWQYFGYHMVIFLAGMSTIPSEVIESARMDGANGFQLFRHITLPLIRPFTQISLVLITTSSLKVFDNVIALTGGGPGHASDVLALHMYNSAFLEMRYGYGSAIGVILLVLNIIVTILIGYIFQNEQRKEKKEIKTYEKSLAIQRKSQQGVETLNSL